MNSVRATLERIESLRSECGITIDEFVDGLKLSCSKLTFKRVYGLERIRFDPEIGLFGLVLPADRRALIAVTIAYQGW